MPSFKLISQNIYKKSPENFSLAGSSSNTPFQVFLSARGPKIAQPWQKSVEIKTLILWVYQIWGLYMIFKAMNADKWLWPIFGCKVSQSVPIGMKLELDVKHRLLHVYAKFQTDISTHLEKKPGKLRKIQNTKIIAKILKMIFFTKNGTYVEKYTAGHLCTKFVEFILINETMIAKNRFDILLAVN